MHKSWYKIPTSAKNPKPPTIEEYENKIHKSEKKLS